MDGEQRWVKSLDITPFVPHKRPAATYSAVEQTHTSPEHRLAGC